MLGLAVYCFSLACALILPLPVDVGVIETGGAMLPLDSAWPASQVMIVSDGVDGAHRYIARQGLTAAAVARIL